MALKRVLLAGLLVGMGIIALFGYRQSHNRRPAGDPVPQDEKMVFREAFVLYNYDGDTLKVRMEDTGEEATVRLKGIDCPESSRKADKCWAEDDLIDIPCEEQVVHGKRASGAARALTYRHPVTLESYGSFRRGNHGRLLAYVRLPDGTDYGYWMLKKGFCVHSGQRWSHPREDAYSRVSGSIGYYNRKTGNSSSR